MANDAWLLWTDPHQLLFRGIVPFLYMEGQRSYWERKLRLWTAACFDRLVPLSRAVRSEAERLLTELADEQISGDEFVRQLAPFRERAVADVEKLGITITPSIQSEALATLFDGLVLDSVEGAEMGALGTSRVLAFMQLETFDDDTVGMNEALAEHDQPIAAMLREIVGNPFRSITFNPSWRTSDVMLLAQGIYADRAFDRMPILADALQDAGCDGADILSHCRDANATHVRGCWVVDLVLGKQ